MKKSDITFSVELDDTKMPINIAWSATDAGEVENNCKAMMLSMWDRTEENTMRIDLWTKDMKVDEMKLFFHQTFVSMINTLERATGADNTILEMREYAKHLAEQLKLIK
jgi:gliding motility-associated protein GldC